MFWFYRVAYLLLYAAAPILTLTVVLSFFKNFVSGILYRVSRRADVYIFSELNERSLALAQSIASRGGDTVEQQYQKSKATLDADYEIRYQRAIKEVENEYADYLAKIAREGKLAAAKKESPNYDKYPLPKPRKVYRAYLAQPAKRSLIVFLGVEENNDEEILLAENARQLGALIFRTGVLTTHLFKKKCTMNFFLINEDETENVGTAIGLLEKYATRDNTNVYVFSDSPESELLLKSAGDETRTKALKEMKGRRLAKYQEQCEAEALREKERLEKQMAEIAKNPSNATLYVTEAESDYRSGALVKRVNIIRSLIYHTFYNFEFLSEHREENEAARLALAEKRVTAVKTALAPVFAEKGISSEGDIAYLSTLTADFLASHGDYYNTEKKAVLAALEAHIKAHPLTNALCEEVLAQLVKQYDEGQKKLAKKYRITVFETFLNVLIESTVKDDGTIDTEARALLTQVFAPFLKKTPFCLNEKEADYSAVLRKYLDKAELTPERRKVAEGLLTPYLTVYPFHEGEAATPYEQLAVLSAQFVKENDAQKKKDERDACTVRNIFESAASVEDENGKKKKVISAVVIGMGLHGTEMLKGLVWYGQMDGYELHINAFDRDPKARSRFAAQCPELMSPKYNSNPDSEDCYYIDIHQADIDSEEFLQQLAKLPKITYVAVCLGNDEKNLEVAVRMRSVCKKMGAYPFIQAIRYNLGENEDFSQAKNYKGQPYDIDLIGDMKSLYSVGAIIRTQYEHEALSRHMKWGGEKSFWEFEYNYNSSIASAIHSKAKKKLNIPGANVDAETRKTAVDPVTKEKLYAHTIDPLRRLEHRRWNAYMRTEGYSYGKTRDDIAKIHHCLVPFDALPEYERTKDDD